METAMARIRCDRFVRLPTQLLESLLRLRLSGTQWRIVGWIIRHTFGWNRDYVAFSWYRIAKVLSLDRGGVVRAGKSLVRDGILCARANLIQLQMDDTHWNAESLAECSLRVLENAFERGEMSQRAVTPNTADGDEPQRTRCRETSVFRGDKDSRKDELKKYRQSACGRLSTKSPRSIAGKYGRLSQN
jgi:phage replication O-like protein O